MRRLALAIAAALVLALPGASAQQRPKVVGYLSMGDPSARDRCADDLAAALRKLGWTEGADYRLVMAHSERNEALLPERARQLAGARPDVLVAPGLHPVTSLRSATPDIPIVALGTGFLLGARLIENIRRPGTNVTGVSLGDTEHGDKSLELMRRLMPQLARVGLLSNRNNPAHSSQSNPLSRAAERLRLSVVSVSFSGFHDIEPAWRRLAAAGVQAVFIQPDLGIYAVEHARLALAHGLPAMTHHHRFARSGGTFAYGYRINFCERGARYVDRILRGQSPRDMPVEEIWDVALVVNLRTVRRLGIALSAEALARADEVIE